VASTDDTQGEREKEERAEVWLVADADHFRAMHDMIVIQRGDEVVLLECDELEFRGEKPIAALLAAAGFSGGSHASPVRVQVTEGVKAGFVPYRGFSVPASRIDEVEMMIRMALAGNLGGFTGVLMGQVGFHRSAFAFEYAWAAAGMPPIKVRQPSLCPSGEGAHGPASIHEHALANPRLLQTLARTNELPEEPEGG
jgi:hypothetical protein